MSRLSISLFSICFASAMAAMKLPTVVLNSGYEMPYVGLGTYNQDMSRFDNTFNAAIAAGYQLIDTAPLYGNEEGVGKTFKKWFEDGGRREHLFITGKLAPWANRPQDVEKSVETSLKKLNLDYFDLYLIHFPFGFKAKADLSGPQENEDGSLVIDHDTDHLAIWKELEKLVKVGKIRSLGVSNFNDSQILRIMDKGDLPISNVQVELHAYNQERPIRVVCAKYGIPLTAYSPLGSDAKSRQIFDEPLIKNLSLKYKKSPAQVVLRYTIQQGVTVIPKSSNPERLKQNINIYDFYLTDEEVLAINDMDRGELGRNMDFLDYYKGVDKHPEYPFQEVLAMRLAQREAQRKEKEISEEKIVENKPKESAAVEKKSKEE